MNSQTKTNSMTSYSPEVQHLHDTLTQQKQAYQRYPVPTAKERIERLARLKKVLLKYQDQIAEAINQDYGNRSITETKIGELITCLEQIKYYSKNLSTWMKPSKRHVGIMHQPSKAWVQYQPLGVIGIIAPWNYPLVLSVGPLICALAAGNHAMIKISSSSMNFGYVLENALSEAFPRELVSVVTGGGVISDAFSHLAFDKIIFTGSTNIGKTVMAAASENLVPVILELGGKSPAIVHPSTDLKDVAQRLAFGKLWNAGQTCVAPDHLFLPKGTTAEFVEQFKTIVSSMYPHLAHNQDYTSIINDKQFNRVQSYLEDAQAQGAQLVEINPKHEDLNQVRKIAPTLVTGVTTEMDIMKNEIFGPVLPIMEYDQIDDVIDFINSRPRPLALYYFDFDDARAQYVAQRTHSGHFGQNALLTHVAQDDLPFGGVGASGMGKYHGPEGFFNLSHERSMMSMPKLFSIKFILPPFGGAVHKILEKTFIR
ncbi:coniferyl aldehyde dehydrogenase [Acinetobacter sichuanensis]|uniref:Aldehyde dehydrogenase n=1 Tax=Acinetobacter sichuanensis TaxID=2136183 RepID=A0A371YUQ8_9GAMM|nr:MULTISPECIES: coniferyl aldehyde dehydrogenase [Acinetobacter]MDM1763950.1 coniferyl aldehyde dehydrogenase [Acinetobacter sp. 226-1]MDM1767684.1 coniferyl aldehyde dehydrogenase [Acinetobacter sp. 226-4]MDQ9020476.1 coniferyl aldehyde dehydrogenase [Acinetobacter sichuanensis]RFC85188.1 coniferyl aldehyde dehydrogenase [Acinetobacter sichuanensis]